MTIAELEAILTAVKDKNKTVYIAERTDLNDNTDDFEVAEIGVSSYPDVFPGLYIITN